MNNRKELKIIWTLFAISCVLCLFGLPETAALMKTGLSGLPAISALIKTGFSGLAGLAFYCLIRTIMVEIKSKNK
jgi:riboflavin transporter FmnP